MLRRICQCAMLICGVLFLTACAQLIAPQIEPAPIPAPSVSKPAVPATKTTSVAVDKTDLLHIFNAEFADTYISVHDFPNHIVLTKSAYFLFSSRNLTLSEPSKHQLAFIANTVNKLGFNKIYIAGFTDNIGDLFANNRKSFAWAKTVQDYLIEQGISADKISHHGYGPFEPVAGNFTEAGRLENQRVEIQIF